MDKFELQPYIEIGLRVLAYDHPPEGTWEDDYNPIPQVKTIKDIRECEYQNNALDPEDLCSCCVGMIQFDDENKPECIDYQENKYLIREIINDFIKEKDFRL